MTCVVRTEGGTTVFVCSRGNWPGNVDVRCQACGRRKALFECDYADPSHVSGTCDRRLCNHRECLATRWGKDHERKDICRAHVETKEPACA